MAKEGVSLQTFLGCRLWRRGYSQSQSGIPAHLCRWGVMKTEFLLCTAGSRRHGCPGERRLEISSWSWNPHKTTGD